MNRRNFKTIAANKQSASVSIFKTFVCLAALMLPVSAAITQQASLLPNAVQQFFDNNGNPLSGGTVTFYVPNTTTKKTIWKDQDKTTAWSNPIVLNAAGRPPADAGIYGDGIYQQLVKSKAGTTIYNQPTSSLGSGGVTPTLVGDGDLVGTVKPWAGLVAPPQYVFGYGQEIARLDYPEFLAAVTIVTNATCSAGSPTLTNIGDTTQVPVGAAVEIACIAGASTVISKTINSITLTANATTNVNTSVTIYPFGAGDGSTTFNVPDLRGLAIAGRDNMGGIARGQLTSAFFAQPGLGANNVSTAAQSYTLLQPNLPNIIPTITVDASTARWNTVASQSVIVVAGGGQPVVSGLFDGGTGGGGVTNYLSKAGLAGGSITATNTSINGGVAQTAFSRVQPTFMLNMIVKITPDVSTSIATGVASIQGMTGVLTCGSGLTCASNVISVVGAAAAGSNTQVQFNTAGNFDASPNFTWASPKLTIGTTGTTGQFGLAGATSGNVTQTAQAVAGTPVITWGTSTGTPAVTATLPLVITAATGNITCPTCATSTLNAAALTKTDDTNVTLTLGGSPTTALLNATSVTVGWTGTLAAGRLNANVVQAITNDTNVTGSIAAQNLTLGWTGTLAMTRGGSGTSLTASNGGIVWTDANSMEVLAGTATARLPLLSGATATPVWGAFTLPASVTSGGLAYFSSASAMASSGVATANAFVTGGGAGASPNFVALTGLVVGNGASAPTAYAGVTCTNQFLRALSAAGASTCNTVSLTADVTGTLPIANGGTGQTTAAAARASTGLNVESLATTGDANVSIAATTRTQQTTATLTASRTWTLPAANAVNPGQSIIVSDAAGGINGANTLVVARAGADTINGATSTTMSTQYQQITLVSNGSNSWTVNAAAGGGGGGTVTQVVCDGVTITTSGTCPPRFGFANCTLAASAAGSALTIALKDNAGNDPTASSPCTLNFRNVTNNTGTWTQLIVTSAQSLVISSGSTLGVTTSTAFRIWVLAFNDGGTFRLAAINLSTASTTAARIYPYTEGQVMSANAEGGAGAADSAGIAYAGASITAKASMILGYLEWSSSGLTAGTWTTTNLLAIQSMGPGIKKPGDVVQTLVASSAAAAVANSVTWLTAISAPPLSPMSAVNPIRIVVSGTMSSPAAAVQCQLRIERSGVARGMTNNVYGGGSAQVITPTSMITVEKPNSVSSLTYVTELSTTGGAGNCSWPYVGVAGSDAYGVMIIEEIQG